MTNLRSERWFGGNELSGFIHRTSLPTEAIERGGADGRPVVGICNPWSDLVTCNLHFRGLAEAVKRGVLQAGGLPLEFPTISLGENLMKPTAMLYRNLMAMDVEECIRAYPLDAVVLIGGCDKTVPAELMGAASADVPAIMITGGPSPAAFFRGRELGAGTDLWHYVDELRGGRMTQQEFDELEAAAATPYGHCNEMGTASTMTSIVEALGMCLPGTASIPAVDAARARAAEETGMRAVEIAREGLRPSQILTAEAFDNAITTLMAIGGGTNAVIHLLALAGRVDVPLTLERFDELSRRTPLIANVRPSGEHLVEHLHRAGGIRAVLHELAPLLHADALTITGRTLGEETAEALPLDRELIRPLDDPLASEGGIVVLRGSLAPAGAIIKRSAASPGLLSHRGPAVVFEDIYDVAARIDDPDARDHRRLRPRAAQHRPEGRPGDAGMGSAADPEAAARAGRDRPRPDLGRADERDGVRDGRPPRRTGSGGRRAAAGGAGRRPDRSRRRESPPRRRRPGRRARATARAARPGGAEVSPRLRGALPRARARGRSGL